MAECEFFVRSWRKPDQVLVERCSLNGKQCFCEDSYLSCTRRTFALKYEALQGAHIPPAGRITRVVLIDPQTKLPST
jgi:hypothetical protein